jgi:regulator of replication initiation timing
MSDIYSIVKQELSDGQNIFRRKKVEQLIEKIEQLQAEMDAIVSLDELMVDKCQQIKAENERLRAQLESAKAWIPQWAQEDDPAEDEAWKNL